MHRRQSSCLHESHSLISHAIVLMLLCQRDLLFPRNSRLFRLSPCQISLHRPAITSHGDVSGSRDSPRRWTSNRTRCTCCRQGRVGESGPGHTRIRDRSSMNRTIRSASRRPGARESGLNRMRIHARSSSNRNVCILSPCQFSFPTRIIPHPNLRRQPLHFAKCGGWRDASRDCPLGISPQVFPSRHILQYVK